MAFVSMLNAWMLILCLAEAAMASSIVSRNVLFACDPSVGKAHFPFCNTSLPRQERVEDLISRLSLQEKVNQLINTAPAIPRLGIPAYQWWGEALHGVAVSPGVTFDGNVSCATSFPQVISTASSFNASLWYLIARATGIEARAMYHAGQATLTMWSPNVNIFRDPRWGRGQETPGEDPHVCSQYAVQFVRGIQGLERVGERERERREEQRQPRNSKGRDEGEGSRMLLTSACCKHFAAYDVEDWMGVDRYHFDAKVTEQDMADTFLPPFRSCVEEGGATCVMCSYNRINGIPACAHRQLLDATLRKTWGFNGYITSDCGAIDGIFFAHQWAASPAEAVADALLAGTDLDCGDIILEYVPAAIKAKMMSESDVDNALRNLMHVRMRLGMFDGDPRQQEPWGRVDVTSVATSAHRQLALEAARESIVLLVNRNGTLPLDRTELRHVAVIGPLADSSEAMLGNYQGIPCHSSTPLQSLSTYVHTIYERGCYDVACESPNFIPSAAQAAAMADATILFLGLDQSQEGEGKDRLHLKLPGRQGDLLEAVMAAASQGPLILVLLSGGPLDVEEHVGDPRVGAVLWGGYPGEAGGRAIAEVLFGDYNPGGRLPMTWYKQEYAEGVSMLDMRMRADSVTGFPGRTHRFYVGPTVFSFGHGLSYSTFAYAMEAPSPILFHVKNQDPFDVTGASKNSTIYVTVSVENLGPFCGSHVVILYVVPPQHRTGSPLRNTVGFRRVHMAVGETVNIKFLLDLETDFSTVDEHGKASVRTGKYRFFVGELEREVEVVGMGMSMSS